MRVEKDSEGNEGFNEAGATIAPETKVPVVVADLSPELQ